MERGEPLAGAPGPAMDQRRLGRGLTGGAVCVFGTALRQGKLESALLKLNDLQGGAEADSRTLASWSSANATPSAKASVSG